jgi:hypothetical protein
VTRRLSPRSARSLRVVVCALLLAGVAGRPARAAAGNFFQPDDADVSIYRIWPWLDGALIVGSNAVTIGFYGFGSGLVHPTCPCHPASVNAFDRLAIGRHSDLIYDLGTATVGLAILTPIALDLWDLRRFWPALQDVVVLGEALSLSGAFATLAKFTVQRPFPRTYANDPSLVHDSAGYRSFYSGHTALAFTALSVASIDRRPPLPSRRYPVARHPAGRLVGGGRDGAGRLALSHRHRGRRALRHRRRGGGPLGALLGRRRDPRGGRHARSRRADAVAGRRLVLMDIRVDVRARPRRATATKHFLGCLVVDRA